MLSHEAITALLKSTHADWQQLREHRGALEKALQKAQADEFAAAVRYRQLAELLQASAQTETADEAPVTGTNGTCAAACVSPVE